MQVFPVLWERTNNLPQIKSDSIIDSILCTSRGILASAPAKVPTNFCVLSEFEKKMLVKYGE